MEKVILISESEFKEKVDNLYKEIFCTFSPKGGTCKYQEDIDLDFNDPVVFKKILERAIEKVGLKV